MIVTMRAARPKAEADSSARANSRPRRRRGLAVAGEWRPGGRIWYKGAVAGEGA